MGAPASLPITDWVGPGVYDIPAATYHADTLVPGGSLSSTGARKLLATCPAVFEYERRNPPAPTDAFDFGHAAHELVLGGGPELVVVPDKVTAKDGGWSTKEAKAFVADVRARGAVPLKPMVYEQVRAMADALRAHPFAGKLFAAGSGTPEASLFNVDDSTGVTLRGRLDWLPSPRSGRMIVPDLKTSKSAQPVEFMKSAASYGYAAQAAWYCDLVRALGLAEDPAFVFVVQEKTAPYVVTVVQPDVVAMGIGREQNRKAINLFAECTRTGHWGGYSDDVVLGSLPYWYEKLWQEAS